MFQGTAKRLWASRETVGSTSDELLERQMEARWSSSPSIPTTDCRGSAPQRRNAEPSKGPSRELQCPLVVRRPIRSDSRVSRTQ